MQSYLPDIPPRRPSRAAWLSLASQMSVTDAKLVLHIIKVCRTWEESTPMFVSFWNLTAKASNSNTACVHLFHKVCAYLKVQQYTRVTLKWGTVKKTDTDILYSGLVLPFSKSFTFKLSPTCVLPAPTGNPKKQKSLERIITMCVAGILLLSPWLFPFHSKNISRKVCVEADDHGARALLPVVVIKHPDTNNLRGKGVSWLTVPGYSLWWLILVV